MPWWGTLIVTVFGGIGTIWAAINRLFPKKAQPITDEQDAEKKNQDAYEQEQQSGRPGQ